MSSINTSINTTTIADNSTMNTSTATAAVATTSASSNNDKITSGMIQITSLALTEITVFFYVF